MDELGILRTVAGILADKLFLDDRRIKKADKDYLQSQHMKYLIDPMHIKHVRMSDFSSFS